MCGICGFTGENQFEILNKMISRLTHRGPDSEGFHLDDQVNLGMRRLSIVDLQDGNQPIFNENRELVVIFNGEIYNYQELRKELLTKGHTFYTDHSDTEVIVHLYEEYGVDWVKQINGMFAVALWDNRNQKLILYRDRVGKKPLYYALKNSQLIFASEIKSLLIHPSVSKRIDDTSLYRYFASKHISAPNSIYHDIKQLLPGHMLIWHLGEVKQSLYWKPDFSPLESPVSSKEAAIQIRRLLYKSVIKRMNCDVPYGAFLSGGIDSSTIVTLMSRAKSTPVLTFCLGYDDKIEGQFKGKDQDIFYARKVAKHLGTEHHEYIINAKIFSDSMPEILCAFDEPFSGTVSTFFLSKFISKYVKVALSGDGADELFGSYLTHRLSFPIARYLNFNRQGKKYFEDFSKEELRLLAPFNTATQFQFLKDIAIDNELNWRDKLAVFPFEERQQLLNRDFLKSLPPFTGPLNLFKEKTPFTATDPLNFSLELDQKELLTNQILPFVDRLSMAHSLEIRCPFLDYELVDFVNSLPGEFKINNTTTKYILKQAVKNLLSKDLINRPKEGFVQPIYSWMHGVLKDWVIDQLQTLHEDIFNNQYLNKIINNFYDGDTRFNARIWSLVCYSIWRKNIRSIH